MIHGELVALPSNERILETLDRYEEFDPLDPEEKSFRSQEGNSPDG